MELLLIRHGQPEWVGPKKEARNDPGLTQLGRAQAAATAAALGTTRIDELLVSTAVRAQQTAAPLAELLGIKPSLEEDLFELKLSPGWDGAPAAEVGEWFRNARDRDRLEWWQGAPGGEGFGEFHLRVTGCVDRLLADRGVKRHSEDGNLWEMDVNDERRFAIVAHAGTNSAILGHLLGVEPEPWEWERFSSSHASITVLRSAPIAGQAIWSLQSFSNVSHLPAETS
jgi:broad specificity phosphatase PhoE